MAVVKRGNSWVIDYLDPQKKRIRKTFKTKKEAVAEYGKRKSLIAEGRYLDVKKEYKTTFGELLKKYEENYQYQRSFGNWKELCLKNFEAYFGKETLLSNIDYGKFVDYRTHLRNKMTIKRTIRTDASINREIACLHHLFAEAVTWQLSDQSPFNKGKSLIVKENNRRLRYLSEKEIPQLLKACSPHLRDIVVCALNTGMRRGEILSLRWDQIKDGQIYLTETKTNTARQIPVNDTLSELFKRIKKDRAGEYVFTFKRKTKKLQGNLTVINPDTGNRIHSVKVAFATALRKSKIQNFKFHDLRHTFASHMIMRGASMKEIQEILGHTTMTMTLRYSHLSQEHKNKAVNLLNGLTAYGTQTENIDVSQNVTKPDFNPSFEPRQTANYLN